MCVCQSFLVVLCLFPFIVFLCGCEGGGTKAHESSVGLSLALLTPNCGIYLYVHIHVCVYMFCSISLSLSLSSHSSHVFVLFVLVFICWVFLFDSPQFGKFSEHQALLTRCHLRTTHYGPTSPSTINRSTSTSSVILSKSYTNTNTQASPTPTNTSTTKARMRPTMLSASPSTSTSMSTSTKSTTTASRDPKCSSGEYAVMLFTHCCCCCLLPPTLLRHVFTIHAATAPATAALPHFEVFCSNFSLVPTFLVPSVVRRISQFIRSIYILCVTHFDMMLLMLVCCFLNCPVFMWKGALLTFMVVW